MSGDDTPRRRESDRTHPRRRREDDREQLLEQMATVVEQQKDLLEHGSKNFRRYRRRAMIAFAGVIAAFVFGLWQVDGAVERTTLVADQTALIAAQATQLGEQVVTQARRACDQNNVVRENQSDGLRFQIDATERQLRRDLGPALEPFREEIVRQHRQRKRNLKALRVPADDFPMRENPYLVDCEQAHPVP